MPGGPSGWESTYQCVRHRFSACFRRSLHAAELLSLCTTTPEAHTTSNLCSAMRSLCTATESSPRSPQLKNALTKQLRPRAAKKKKKKKIYQSKTLFSRQQPQTWSLVLSIGFSSRQPTAAVQSRSKGQMTKPICKVFDLQCIKMSGCYSKVIILKRLSNLNLENCKWFSKILLWILASFPTFLCAASFSHGNSGYLTITWYSPAFPELFCQPRQCHSYGSCIWCHSQSCNLV